MAAKIHGIIPPILTPMYEDETVNEQELRQQVDRMIAGGVHGVFCFGTNGEGYILSEKEKERVLEIVVEQTAGRVPVYAGTGCTGTKNTVRMSQMAQRLGADVLSIITPYFATCSQDELYDHYRTIAEKVDLPIVLYNIPARTGINIAPATVARLAEIDNIVGVKDSSGNFDNMKQYIELTCRRDFAVLSGNDSLIIWCLLAGGKGGIAGCANVYPQTMASIYEAFITGDIPRAMMLQDSIRSFRNCFRFGNPNTIVKTAVRLLGYDVGPCRAPFRLISTEGLENLKNVLKENISRGMH